MFYVHEKAVKAEDKYRREPFEQPNQAPASTKKTALTIVVASALAIVLTACGIPTEGPSVETPSLIADMAPVGNPDLGAVPVPAGFDAGVLAGPGWQPNPVTFDAGVFAGPGWGPNLPRTESGPN